MSKLTILDHHLDPVAGHYRLEIGWVTEHMASVLDEHGEPVMLPDEPVLNEDGSPALNPDGTPLVNPGPPMLEKVQQVEGVEDFLFVADDPRWKGKTPKEIATEQQEIVRAALAEREAVARRLQAERDQRKALPGIGTEL